MHKDGTIDEQKGLVISYFHVFLLNLIYGYIYFLRVRGNLCLIYEMI